eukprot:5287981-Prymnesium_polylepis.1
MVKAVAQPRINYGGGAHHDSYFPRTANPWLTRANDRGGSNFHARARAHRCACGSRHLRLRAGAVLAGPRLLLFEHQAAAEGQRHRPARQRAGR